MIQNIKNKRGGFLQLIIIIIIALLVMRYFGLTFTKIFAYFGVTWSEIIGWFKIALDWLRDLFTSVK